MSEVVVLMPTFNKTKNDILSIVNSLNIKTKSIVSNQINEDGIIVNDKITIINNNTRGVSVNRNILLSYVHGDYCLFIDDDCQLVNNYEKIVLDSFSRYPSADVVVYSRDSEDDMFLPVKLKEGKAKFFHRVSKMGAPGIAIKVSSIKKYNLCFNEKLGTPNYFYNGEDSFFLYELFRKKANVYTSSSVIFKLLPSKNKSSYFTNYNEQFFESVGGIQYLLHRFIYPFYFIKQGIYYHTKTKQPLSWILKCFNNGKKKIMKLEIC